MSHLAPRGVWMDLAKRSSELDHGPTYVVRRLWDPGRPSYTSRSIFPIDLEILGQPKSYLDYIYQLASSSQPFLVILVLN